MPKSSRGARIGDGGGRGSGGQSGSRRERGDAGKPPSNPRGWPDRSSEADKEERRHREISINDEQDHSFCNNFVRTSKVRSKGASLWGERRVGGRGGGGMAGSVVWALVLLSGTDGLLVFRRLVRTRRHESKETLTCRFDLTSGGEMTGVKGVCPAVFTRLLLYRRLWFLEG